MKLSRRDFVKTAGAVAVAAASAGPSGSEGASPQPGLQDKTPGLSRGKHPNVLVILCDQMRFPSVYESEALKTFRQQHLTTQNQLREGGIEFTRHYAASSACSPSRACMLTGHYPSLHGVSQTYGGAKEACDPDVFWLDPNSVPTFGNYFRAAGYRTYWKGKWHVSDAEMLVPGTHIPLLSYDPKTGERDPDKEALYVAADRLGPYGFAGWIGPEPHGPNPLRDTGSSRAHAQPWPRCRLRRADRRTDPAARPRRKRSALAGRLLVREPARHRVFSQPTHRQRGLRLPSSTKTCRRTRTCSGLSTRRRTARTSTKKPRAQKSYRENYAVWGGPIPEEHRAAVPPVLLPAAQEPGRADGEGDEGAPRVAVQGRHDRRLHLRPRRDARRAWRPAPEDVPGVRRDDARAADRLEQEALQEDRGRSTP